MTAQYRITHKPKSDTTTYVIVANNGLTAVSKALMYWTGSRFSLDAKDAKPFLYNQAQKQLYHKKITSLKSRGHINSVRMEEVS